MAQSIGMSVNIGANLGGLKEGTQLARNEVGKLGRIMRQAEDPAVKLERDVNLLTRALNSGEISQKDYGRAVESLNAKYKRVEQSHADMTRETLTGTKAVSEFGATMANQLGGGVVGMIAGNLSATQEKLTGLTEAMKNGQISASQFKVAVGAGMIALAAQVGYAIGEIIADAEQLEKVYDRQRQKFSEITQRNDQAQIDSQKDALEAAKAIGGDEIRELHIRQKQKAEIVKNSIFEMEQTLAKLEGQRSMFGETFETAGFKNAIKDTEQRIVELRAQYQKFRDAIKETEKARGTDFHTRRMKEIEEAKKKEEEIAKAKVAVGGDMVESVSNLFGSVSKSVGSVINTAGNRVGSVLDSFSQKTEKAKKMDSPSAIVSGSQEAYKLLISQQKAEDDKMLRKSEEQRQLLDTMAGYLETLVDQGPMKVGVIN